MPIRFHLYKFLVAVIYDKSLFCSIYKNAAAVMILYDISKHTSFQDAVADWLEEVEQGFIILLSYWSDTKMTSGQSGVSQRLKLKTLLVS